MITGLNGSGGQTRASPTVDNDPVQNLIMRMDL